MQSPRFTRDARADSGTRALALRHGVGLIALVVALIFGFAPAAQAHTDFEFSDPADGSAISVPVSEIRIGFTAASLLAGDGFVVLTPTGEVISPEFTVSPDQREFTLLFEPPLVNGAVGVQWSVRAGDAHPIEGTFSFTTTATARAVEPQVEAAAVDEPADGGLETAAPDVAGSQTAPVPLSEPAATIVPDSGGVQTAPVQESAPQAASDPETFQGAIVDSSESETAAGVDAGEAAVDAGAVTLDQFLNVDDGGGLAGPVGYVGRLASQAGSLIAIGVVAFALLVSERSLGEMRVFVNLVRQAGVVTIGGALVEAVGLVMSLGSFSDALVGSAGFAVLLRLVGAAGLIASTGAFTAATQSPGTVVAGHRSLVRAGGAFSGSMGTPENHQPVDAAVALRGESVATLGGAAWWFAGLIALSYVFDGHTVTKGSRLLTGVIHLVHVAGAAVWLGGLVCLLVLSRSRRAKLDPAKFIESVVRFSVIAAVALGAVGVAGLALTVTILDSVSELWSTAWGRLLIAKVITVAVAIGAGAFNHFVLVPELQSISAHDDARASFVRTLSIEVAALGAALLVTAALVAAAS